MADDQTHSNSIVAPASMRRRFAVRCAAAYALAGVLWILFSDRILRAIVAPGSELELTIQTFKGWAFVLASAGVLLWAIGRFERRVETVERELRAARAQLEGRVREQDQELETASAAVRQTNQDLDALADSVARDFRAPLRAITGFADIVRRRYAGQTDPEAARYVEHIGAAADQMSALVDDLGAYTRLSVAAARRVPVELSDVVAHAVEALAGRIRETNATLNVIGQLPVVVGEKTLLRQIAICLIDNALKFSKPQEPPAVEVWAGTEADGKVCLCVRDRGIGIPAEHHGVLFRPFKRLHTQDEFPGAGLGLASVKRAAAMMGGEVSLDSEAGRGSTFKVILPAASV